MKSLAKLLRTGAIVMMCACTSSFAADQTTPKRFPWDRRPMKCFAPEAIPTSPLCAELPNWPDWSGTSSRVQSLFTEPDFDLIARAERELADSTQTFPNGDYYFDAWYWALYVMFDQQPTRYRETLEKWKTATGGEGHVLLAEVMMRIGEGWEARGSGFANTVSPEAWAIYRARLEEADALLVSAPPALKKTGAWHALNLSLALQLNQERGADGPAFRSAVAVWPTYARIYKMAISLSSPRWGGSFNDVEAVVRYAYEKTKATEGAAWYANLYTDYFVGSSQYTLRDSNANWTLMKKGFRDAMGKPGTDGRLFSFAMMACQVRDREEAKRLYDLIDQLPEAMRPKNTTGDPCRMFANGADPKGI